jgi:5-methylcytosine-specific restriction protein B
MSKHHPNRDPVPILEAAAGWAARCLAEDGSVLAEGESLWTLEYLDQLDRAFVQNLEEGEGSFLEKLQKQLISATPPARRLMAEALWALMLFQSNIGAERKRAIIQAVWSWSGEEVNLASPMLADAVLQGLGSAGTAYSTQRWRELSFMITGVRAFKRKTATERRALLDVNGGGILERLAE